MRLVSFQSSSGPAWGLVGVSGVVASTQLGSDVPASVFELVNSPHWPALVRELPERAKALTGVPMGSLDLLPGGSPTRQDHVPGRQLRRPRQGGRQPGR